MTKRSTTLVCGTLAALLLSGGRAPAQMAATPAPTAEATPAPTAATTSAAAATASEKRVEVTLKYDPSNPSVPVGINTPTPDPVPLSKGKKQRAHWYLLPHGSGKMTISMKNATPFKNPPKNNGEDSVSDPPSAASTYRNYHYAITVELKDGKKLTLDPIIKITP